MLNVVAESYLGIPLPDFIRLHGLQPGMIITFKGMQERLIVGNCTPFETVTATSEEGWAYDIWQRFLVVQVQYIDSVNMSAPNWLTPKQVEIIKENIRTDKIDGFSTGEKESIIPESVVVS